MDFTLTKYRQFLIALKERGYTFLTYSDYIQNNSSLVTSRSSLCILRHDVDKLPGNSLTMAKIEAEFGIKGTYYFRIVPESFDETIISQIAELGHEVGYHYEEIDTAYRQLKIRTILRPAQNDNETIGQSRNLAIKKFDNEDLIDSAYKLFKVNLEKIRTVADIKTICMHGSPLSPYDNKLIWGKYNYRDLGIIGEPYLDINWKEFGYLTDTGRRWDGGSVSVRDKVKSKKIKDKSNFKNTKDIIDNIDLLPDKMMFTIHPQRWTNDILPWTKELVLQNVKNVVKRVIAKRPERS